MRGPYMHKQSSQHTPVARCTGTAASHVVTLRPILTQTRHLAVLTVGALGTLLAAVHPKVAYKMGVQGLTHVPPHNYQD